jgi:putative flavoprotein involved in K+ transport
MPRRYRGKDAFHWFAVTGHLDETLVDLEGKRDTVGMRPQGLSGANGGEELDLAVLAELGVTMTGRLRGFVGNHALFGDDLHPTVEDANARMRRLLAEIDWYIEGLPHGERPNAQWIAPVALPVQATTVDLRAANVSTLIWATGYRRSYPWLNVNVLDGNREITHRRGVTPTSGLYALGLRFQHRRKSHFIGGVGADAHFIATQLHKHTHHTRARHRVRPEPSAS